MCTSLIRGWRSRERHPETGKRGIVYSFKSGLADLRETVPCGQCMECRLKRSREMAIRCVHEASLHGQLNSVVTLTYAPEHLPPGGSLQPEDAATFAKDLRAREDYQAEKEQRPVRRFKTYGCAEYGEKHGRPHYHICLFGYDFDDKKPYLPGVEGYYTSELLDDVWGKGQTQIMDLTFESAAYVARYITKKLTGPRAIEYGDKVPERPVCVTRKGLGKEWYRQWAEAIYQGDQVFRNTKDGRRIPMSPPKYYDNQYEIDNPTKYLQIKNQRQKNNQKKLTSLQKQIQNHNYTNAFNQGIGSRDKANQECKAATWRLLKRGYESDT